MARKDGGALSQNYSEIEPMGLNQSERVHKGDSSTGGKPLSSHQRFMDHSGAALLNNDDSSKQLGDINLSNIILNNGGTGKGIFEDEDEELDAEAFIAQNTTNVRRRPTSSHKSRASKRSRKGSKHDEAEGIDPNDDDFINDVTEPMKAKTKNELLGRGQNRSSSRQSSKSRSRSRSNEIS